MRISLSLIVLGVLVLSGCKLKDAGSGTASSNILKGGTLRIPIEGSANPRQLIDGSNFNFGDVKWAAIASTLETPSAATRLDKWETSDEGATWIIPSDAEESGSVASGLSSLGLRLLRDQKLKDSPLASQVMDLIKGAADYRVAKAHEVAGIHSQDSQVTVTLNRNFMEFPVWARSHGLWDAPSTWTHTSAEESLFGIGDGSIQDSSLKVFAHSSKYPAQLDSVDFIFEPDRHKQFELYKAGKLDTCNVAPEDMAEVLADPALKKQLHTYDTAATLVGFIDLHATPWGDAPFKDKTPLRQAVNWAVYRNELAENSGGMFEPWPHFLPKALRQYIDPAALSSPLYQVEPDIDKAKEGEALAGHDQASLLPTNMLLSYVDDPFLGQLAEGIRENLDEISIRMRPYPCKTQDDALKLVKIGSMDIWLQWIYPAYQSPDALFYPALYSKLEGLGGNYGRCNEKEIDKLIEKAQAEPDESVRTRLYQQLENEVEKRGLFLILGSGKANILINPKLGGYELSPYDFDASLPAQDFSKLGFTE
jgi:ABC-type transport system substrate-binding protein